MQSALMKPTQRWVEEHLGWKIDLRFFSRKVWKAYLLHVCPSLVMMFGGGAGVTLATPVQARPQEVKPHVPSQSQSSTATLEGANLFEAATTSISSSVRVKYVYKTYTRKPKLTKSP